jgi:hypothetical protein
MKIVERVQLYVYESLGYKCSDKSEHAVAEAKKSTALKCATIIFCYLPVDSNRFSWFG